METEISSKRSKKSKKDKDSKKKKSSKHKKHKKHQKKRTRHEEEYNSSSSGSDNEKNMLDNEFSNDILHSKKPDRESLIQDESDYIPSGGDSVGIQPESSTRTIFTNFRNPFRRETFKRPQEETLYHSPTSSDNNSRKRSRSPSPSNHDRMKTVTKLNKLQAKVLRARLMNMPNADELEKQYNKAKKRAESGSESNFQVLPTFDSRGRLYDLQGQKSESPQHAGPSRRKKEKIDTHDASGERIRYFEDDDNLSLTDLVRREKMGTRDTMDSHMASRIMKDTMFQDDLEYMDEKADNIARIKSKTFEQKKEFAIRDFKKSKKALDTCIYCLKDDSRPQVAMVSLGYRAYLALPNVVEMSKGHCLIVPVQHVTSTLECDDDVWDEIRNFMKCLIQMFADEDQGVVFMETVINMMWNNHTVIECIPIPWDLAQDAPAYFKEGILESSGEWSQNKKLIDTSKTSFRRSMVKELPYFHVWFGLDKGYGHVIEKEKSFPSWFGKEILAGICDLPPNVWRKPKRLDSRDNPIRVREFKKKWDKWDWTKMLHEGQ
ncbi:CwfJ C-terminus 1-domain-containing protein-like protein [Rhizophagus clarus]|uniref:CwfJ C-terminus 1-domain-containing protein-like protein n=1 Tax=Rhizophagus clarus TaxID=94130 RepID=A0A8H3LFG4_9GLOM|nr:CwfJ C-terminus 1-domain-containing protein-like protein [Rhizophagus clarus]